jgi:outer membrane immunogenic protein
MQKTLVAATVAALVGVAGAANAADIYSGGGLKDAYVPAPSWTAFHVGLGVGGEAVNHELSVPLFGASLDGISSTGVIGTVEVGYDRQFGNIVAGVFFNYDFGDNVSTSLDFAGINIATLKQTDSWTVGGRLGYLASPSTLVYALAGYTESTFELSVPIFAFTGDDTFSGWTVGGGIETKLGGNWTLKGEYRYTELDTKTYLAFLDVDTSVQTARAVVSYKFDPFGGDVLPLK